MKVEVPPLFAFLVVLSFSLACDLHQHVVPMSPDCFVRRSSIQPLGATAIMNVRVFDGFAMTPPRTIYIDQDRISVNPIQVDHTINACGQFLMPGLIDSHVHLAAVADLEDLSSYGVTTAMQMACFNYTACHTLRGHEGLTDFYTAGSLVGSYPPGSGQVQQSITDPKEQVDWVFGNHSDCAYALDAENRSPHMLLSRF